MSAATSVVLGVGVGNSALEAMKMLADFLTWPKRHPGYDIDRGRFGSTQRDSSEPLEDRGRYLAPQGQPKVNEKASTSPSRNSISKVRLVMGLGARMS